MARKVFISFLGTTNYVNCHYKFDDGTLSEPVRFVQEAIIAKECREWSENDVAFIFTTRKDETTGVMGSLELNWKNDGHQKISEPVESVGLQQRLEELKERMGLRLQIEQVNIEAGHTEEEIWNIFETVYRKLNSGDMIYFDVTHAFRSIPLFSIVLFNYSKYMKDTNLIAILYGAFEKLGPGYKVKEIPLNERIAPIVNMTSIARLQQYNQMASDMKMFGKVSQLGGSIQATDDIDSSDMIQKLYESITDLEHYILCIDLKSIKRGVFIKDFRLALRKLKGRGVLPKPINNILDELNSMTSGFVESESFKNIEAAIEWTIKYDMLMQTYPMAEEYIILRMADIFRAYKTHDFKDNTKFREFIGGILGAPENDFTHRNWKYVVAEHAAIANCISDFSIVPKVRDYYEEIRTIRNSLAHGNGSVDYAKVKEGVIFIKNCIKCLNEDNTCVESIFVNLSNHPSCTWQAEQLKAAEKYGRIIDIPFPSILPDASEKVISKLVDSIVTKVHEYDYKSALTVHIMGEMTFTYMMVQRLKSMGIRCVASTTERDVEEHDGKKTSEFRFVRFREY